MLSMPAFHFTVPSPPLLSPPPPDYDLDEETFTANGKPYHHQSKSSHSFILAVINQDLNISQGIQSLVLHDIKVGVEWH